MKYKNLLKIAIPCYVGFDTSKRLNSHVNLEKKESSIEKNYPEQKKELISKKIFYFNKDQIDEEHLYMLKMLASNYKITLEEIDNEKDLMLSSRNTFSKANETMPNFQNGHFYYSDGKTMKNFSFRNKQDYHKLQNMFKDIININSEEDTKSLIKEFEDYDLNSKLFIAVIPNEKVYQNLFTKYNFYDSYNLSKIQNLQKLEFGFEEFKDNLTLPLSNFVIIRNEEQAKLFNLSFNNIGNIYCLERESAVNNFDKTLKIKNIFYSISQIDKLDKSILNESSYSLSKHLQKNLFILNYYSDVETFYQSLMDYDFKSYLLVHKKDEEPTFINKLHRLKSKLPSNCLIAFTKDLELYNKIVV